MHRMIFTVGMLLSACGSDDPVESLRADAGLRRDQNRPGIPADSGFDNRPLRPDVGLRIPDQGFLRRDTQEHGDTHRNQPTTDSGPLERQDTGTISERDAGELDPVEPPLRRSRLLQQRQLFCDGEEISSASFTWRDGALTRIQVEEVGFPVFDWRITQEAGRPLRARSDVDGWALEAEWSFRGDRLDSASMGDAEESIEWRFEYDAVNRPIAMTVAERIDDRITERRSEATWGPMGPAAFFGTTIRYTDGRPSTINDVAAVLYDRNDILQGVGGGAFALRYGQTGALSELDLLDGCRYRFTWANGEPTSFRGSLGLGDFAMLYDVEGRYIGDFDPGSELYLVILLLLGE